MHKWGYVHLPPKLPYAILSYMLQHTTYLTILIGRNVTISNHFVLVDIMTLLKACRLLFFVLLTPGCTVVNAISATGQVAAMAMELAGMTKTTEGKSEARRPDRLVTVRLHASDSLNSGSKGRPLSLIVRLVELREADSFQQAPYEMFLDPRKQSEVLGSSLVGAKEIVLVPGQHYEIVEKIGAETRHIGIAGLFHSPAARRWKATFAVDRESRSGITLGVHSCAFVIGTGTPPIDPWYQAGAAKASGCER